VTAAEHLIRCLVSVSSQTCRPVRRSSAPAGPSPESPVKPHPFDTAASYRAAVHAFRDGAMTDEERAHLARLEDAERPIAASAVRRAVPSATNPARKAA